MDSKQQRIKIAVQKSGRLTEHSLDLLERCGLKFTKSKDQLFCFGENMPVDRCWYGMMTFRRWSAATSATSASSA